MKHRTSLVTVAGAVALLLCTALPSRAAAPPSTPATTQSARRGYEYPETRALVALVDDAAKLLEAKGTAAAFAEFRTPNSRWRQGENYVFVLDTDGKMLVHPDPALEGKGELDLKDVNGRPIIRGLIHAATAVPGRPTGWYHYEWPVPGGLLPRWKSSYVRLVTPAAGAGAAGGAGEEGGGGKRLIVGSGMYDDRMERAFVVDMVQDAVAAVEQRGRAAFDLFRDRTGPFVAKDTYVFVDDPSGVALVSAGFPSLEGRDISGVKDARGKPLVREMLRVAETQGAGWVDYMWPKPGEGVPTQKSAYVSRAKTDGGWVIVGAGVYLPGAPKAAPTTKPVTAPELMALVRDAAGEFERRGADAFPDFRRKGSRWFQGDTYFFALAPDGTRVLQAGDPALEGKNVKDAKDVRGRPYGQRLLAIGQAPTGEGWVHYMYPEPGGLFPVWKSSFAKRVRFPDGKDYVIGAGAYNMPMDRAFIRDVVDRAAALVAERGRAAFPALRDPTGRFDFMDTYVFVNAADGTCLVNPGQPSLEGKNLMGVRDLKGKAFVRDYMDAATQHGTAWVEYYWYRPGSNDPTLKRSYVRTVHAGPETFVVGSGFYPEQ